MNKWLDWGSIFGVIILLLYPAMAQEKLVGEGIDLYGTVWFYGWIKFCLENGVDPSFTDWFFYPSGKDIFAHTGNNFVDALISVTFQWLFGTPRYYSFFIASIFLSNVWGLRVVLGKWKLSPMQIWFLCMLWLMNPFILSEMTMGRPTQCLLLPAFLAIAVFIDLHQQSVAPLKNACKMGVFVALQGWIYWYYGYFLAFGLLLVVLGRWWHLCRRNILQELRLYLIAIAMCLLCIFPAIWKMIHLLQRGAIPGILIDKSGSFSDISEQMVHWVRGYQLNEILGHPMFASMIWGLVLLLGLFSAVFKYNRPLLWVLFMYFLLAMGPVIVLSENLEILNIPYLLLVKFLPFWSRLWFPYRMLSGIFVVLILIIAGVLKNWGEHRQSLLGCLGLFTVGIGLFENHQIGTFPIPTTSWNQNSVINMIDEPIIELPIGFAKSTMMWQVLHQQPTFGGMGENLSIFASPNYQNRLSNPFIRFLTVMTTQPHNSIVYAPLDRKRIEDLGFVYLSLNRQMVELELNKHLDNFTTLVEVEDQLILTFGYPLAMENEIWLWNLQQPIWIEPPNFQNNRQNHQYLLNPYSDYEQKLQNLGRLPKFATEN